MSIFPPLCTHFIQVFTSVALFNILISPLNAFPWVLNGLVEAWVSAKRVQSFLQLEELDLNRYYVYVTWGHNERKNPPTFGTTGEKQFAGGATSMEYRDPDQNVPPKKRTSGNTLHVCIMNGCFTWKREDEGTGLTGKTTTTECPEPDVGDDTPDTRSIGMFRKASLDPYESESDGIASTSPLLPTSEGDTLLHSFTHSLKRGKGQSHASRDSQLPSSTGKATAAQDVLEEPLEDRNGSCYERKDESPASSVFELSGINLKIERGQLVGVIGRVGSGKTSLLNAISAEMRKKEGEVLVEGLTNGFGLAAQEAWIQHATVKENILFGEAYEEDKYRDVIFVCALEQVGCHMIINVLLQANKACNSVTYSTTVGLECVASGRSDRGRGEWSHSQWRAEGTACSCPGSLPGSDDCPLTGSNYNSLSILSLTFSLPRSIHLFIHSSIALSP